VTRRDTRLVSCVEPAGSFSVVALVWQPGQATTIHDHVTWGAFAVLRGTDRHRAPGHQRPPRLRPAGPRHADRIAQRRGAPALSPGERSGLACPWTWNVKFLEARSEGIDTGS
jgi:predicted metal-dependent enzyme (double-stranded beta helix superfamily)